MYNTYTPPLHAVPVLPSCTFSPIPSPSCTGPSIGKYRMSVNWLFTGVNMLLFRSIILEVLFNRG